MALKTQEQTPTIQVDGDEVPPLVENPAGVPVVYADGPADLEIQGPNCRITYFEFRKVGDRRVRWPVLEMVRPLATCGNGGLSGMVARKRGVRRAH